MNAKFKEKFPGFVGRHAMALTAAQVAALVANGVASCPEPNG
jgi:menaquinone-dependent protoporphyrinogen IX oxidase